MSATTAVDLDVPDSFDRRVPRAAVAEPALNFPHRRVRRGEALYRMGDTFSRLYVVRAGAIKCFIVSGDGSVQVTGFPIAGDVFGLDGIGSGRHRADAVALDDGEVFLLPYAQCERWARDSAHGQRLMMRALASAIVRGHEVMMMLGSMRAEQRVAIFLLDLAGRYGSLGYSRSHLTLRMSRQDIACYLGLTLETVSRCLSRLQQCAAIQVQGRIVDLLDCAELWRTCGLWPDALTPPCEPILDRDGMLTVEAGTGRGPLRC